MKAGVVGVCGGQDEDDAGRNPVPYRRGCSSVNAQSDEPS